MLRHLASLALCLCACVSRSTADDVGADATASEASSAPTTTSATSDVTTSTTASADTTDAAPTTGGPSCEGYTIPIVIPLVTLSLTLVIDQSPAMLDPWDHDGDPQTPDLPRWTSVRDVLLAVLSPLESVRLGLAPYPTPDADDGDGPTACAETPALLVPTSDDPPPDVLAGLAPADPPPGSFGGGAPLRRAIAAAVASNDGPLDQPRALAVFANSAANCSPEAAGPALLESLDVGVLDAAAAAQAAGLPVYVFGIGASTDPSPALVDRRPDGVVVSDALKDLATAGGGAYIPVHSEAELAASLAAFFASEPDTTCTLSLDPPPGPGQAVTSVTIGDVTFPPVEDCATQDGWRMVDDALELCGAACLQFGAQGGLEIEVSCVS